MGCGWFGLPLALSLKEKGYDVLGTKRTKEGADSIQSLGIPCRVFDISSRPENGQADEIFNADVVLINVPLGRKNFKPELFFQNIISVFTQCKQSKVRQVIFISTTSVYGSIKGTVTEETPTEPDTSSGETHSQIENYLLTEMKEQGLVMRFAGLVGGRRHPATFLSGRTGITNGLDCVNLIHRDDCISAIEAIISKGMTSSVMHLSSLQHPTRDAFYTWAAQGMKLPLPEFNKEGGNGKCIDATQTLNELGISLKYPSPYDMPLPEPS
ncbi:NAD(P)-dependent oxidoreductase [Veronia nyctiphanis]|uniref:NAD(P)-dependent oxidoreductase n=1 Tax=Veronia nyctiphanis TaxID=1278244 RepID=A0A4Q0YRC8_9GAMM|nr:NAD(P)-dependent oxidoreductase [Veronia nyctiphanis]